MACVLDFGLWLYVGVFRYLLSIVIECPDLLLTSFLFVTDKELVHSVLDIARVFAAKLVDDWALSGDLIASVFARKLDTDVGAPFNDSVGFLGYYYHQ